MNKRRRRLARHRRKFRCIARVMSMPAYWDQESQEYIKIPTRVKDQMGYIGLGLSYVDAVP